MPASGESEPRTLAELRAEIDRIDAAMHALLIERSSVIDALIKVKGTGLPGAAFRPAREADMMRRLVKRHRGALPLTTAEHIWRVIIATFTHMQAAYGVVAADPVPGRDDLFVIKDLVEKPKREDAPSCLAIIGRYLLVPEIFASLEAIPSGAIGEIQLTDGLRHLLRSQPIYGLKFEGRRYDAGDKLGFLEATVEYALRHEKLGAPFREYLKGLSL